MNVTEQITALLNEGLSYYRMAKETGINKQTLINWHKGKTKPANNLMIEAFNKYYKKVMKNDQRK